MLKLQLTWQWCIPRLNIMLLLFGIHIITMTETNWNQSSEGLLDGFSVIIEELVQYQQLSWPSLQIRQNILRLKLSHKIFNHQTSLSIPTYCLPVTRDNTRHYHPNQFILPPVSTTSHLKSFFSWTIKEWNNLLRSILNITDNETFFNNYLQQHLMNTNTANFYYIFSWAHFAVCPV